MSVFESISATRSPPIKQATALPCLIFVEIENALNINAIIQMAGIMVSTTLNISLTGLSRLTG